MTSRVLACVAAVLLSAPPALADARSAGRVGDHHYPRPVDLEQPPEQLGLFPPGGHLTQAPYRTPVPPCAYR